MTDIAEMTEAEVAAYKRDYERGWRSSQGPNHMMVLERADGNPATTNAWYDGYEDYACGWPKWSSAPWNPHDDDGNPIFDEEVTA